MSFPDSSWMKGQFANSDLMASSGLAKAKVPCPCGMRAASRLPLSRKDSALRARTAVAVSFRGMLGRRLTRLPSTNFSVLPKSFANAFQSILFFCWSRCGKSSEKDVSLSSRTACANGEGDPCDGRSPCCRRSPSVSCARLLHIARTIRGTPSSRPTNFVSRRR